MKKFLNFVIGKYKAGNEIFVTTDSTKNLSGYFKKEDELLYKLGAKEFKKIGKNLWKTSAMIRIANIFDLNTDRIQYIKRGKDRFVDEYFTIKFIYKNIHIEILNMSDYMYRNYYDISVKKDIENQECMQTSIERLIAYYMEKKFNMKYTFENMIHSLIILKKFIDEDKLFFETYDNKLKKRFFYIDNRIIELPWIINANIDKEMENFFGKDVYKVLDNKPIYK